jgi:phage replication O-like protein O
MNYLKQTTQVPNGLFDSLLKSLSEKELKVLLVVIRQTLGWVDSNGNRKRRDWISQKYFRNKTGLSGKAVSQAIELLVNRNLIIATTTQSKILSTSNARRGQDRIFFECSNLLLNNVHKLLENTSQDPRKINHNTKITHYKTKARNQGLQSVSKVLQNNNHQRPQSGAEKRP